MATHSWDGAETDSAARKPAQATPDLLQKSADFATLWGALTTVARRRCGNQWLAEDLAGEAVLRAWLRFGVNGTWQDLWRWSTRVMERLRVSQWRRCSCERTVCCGSLESFPAPIPEATDAGKSVRPFIDLLRDRLQPPERDTLALLAGGVHRNEAIAAVRGVHLRCIQESRRKIRVEAAKLWE